MREGGRQRVIIEAVSPSVECGRYPAKRIVGDTVVVECDLIADGHDAIAGRALYRLTGTSGWQVVPLEPLPNDRWRASFVAREIGIWEVSFEAWVDAHETWRRGVERKRAAGQDVSQEVAPPIPAVPDVAKTTRYERALKVVVEPELARSGAWYELFPRSCASGSERGAHGTFRDVEKQLDYVAGMGFDVLYLPPIHPIGRSFRKGPNNSETSGPRDPGSPWAIGAEDGGHKAVHRELGTLADFRHLVAAARAKKIEIALDIAFQVSPDHPWVREHPEWFVRRPDGTIQYAENPPKKYQDVYPFDFESEEAPALWRELLDVFLFWVGQGVKVFRVDNPHTKSLRFWEWCIRELKAKHPEVLLLAEAFTRPKVMYALAKGGFSQSYTYFTWRNTKHELEAYMRELTRPPVSDFFRPSFWPNTPDILPEHLQHGGRATFVLRLVLAATLSSNYGIYGPPFELMEHVAAPGAEDYQDSEKYQLRTWNLDRADSLSGVITLLNRARRENAALQQTNRIAFHRTEDDALFAFSKRTEDFASVVLVVANMDPQHAHAGWVELDLGELGLRDGETFQVHDVLADARYLWTGGRNYVELDPSVSPVSVFVVRRKIRTEHDFEYFL